MSTNDGVVWGGSEELWAQAALRLASAGWSVTVCARRWPQRPQAIADLARNSAVLVLRSTPSLFRRLLRRLRDPWSDEQPSELLPALKAGPFDMVVVSNGGTVPAARDARAICAAGYPFLNICQANREDFFVDDPELDSIQQYARSARAMVFVSDANRELFESQAALRLSNAVVVRNPYGVRFENRHAAARFVEGRPMRLACVGRLHPPSKGQDLLIAALARPRWRARDWSLKFAGTGPFRRGLQGLAAMHAIADRIEFLGHVADIERFWADHDVLVLPSRYEGMPLALVEAMLCARLVVTTRVAGAPELVTEGVNGFLAEAASVDALDAALERAYAARFRWAELGESARRAARLFATADPVGSFVDLIRSLAGQRHGAG